MLSVGGGTMLIVSDPLLTVCDPLLTVCVSLLTICYQLLTDCDPKNKRQKQSIKHNVKGHFKNNHTTHFVYHKKKNVTFDFSKQWNLACHIVCDHMAC